MFVFQASLDIPLAMTKLVALILNSTAEMRKTTDIIFRTLTSPIVDTTQNTTAHRCGNELH